MVMLNKSVAIAIFASLLVTHTFSGESGFKLEPMHASANWEVGEIENYDNLGNQGVAENRSKQLISHSAVWLLQEARLAENARVFLGVGGMYFFIPASPSNNYSFGQRSAFGLTDAHGEFEFWSQGESDHGLLLKVGVFPFKYNEDAKNLGEYMFRTYTYPTVIYTGGLVLLNTAGAQLNGIDVNTKIRGVNNDLMVTIKTDQAPSGSLSLTDMISYSCQNFFTIGAGYMFDNVYDPTNLANGTFDKRSDYFVLKDGTVAYRNGSGTPPDSSLVASSGHYTFEGQKVMARASVDLGNIVSKYMPNPFLGDKQFRLYFETILMGVKNYPGYYDKLTDRIAYMYGVDLPTFGILNVLSVEAEYCHNQYPENTNSALIALAPIPYTDGGNSGLGDNLKWTVYARKNVLKSFSITAQAASDHARLVDFFGHYYDQTIMQHTTGQYPDSKWWKFPLRIENWYWAFQLSYSI